MAILREFSGFGPELQQDVDGLVVGAMRPPRYHQEALDESFRMVHRRRRRSGVLVDAMKTRASREMRFVDKCLPQPFRG